MAEQTPGIIGLRPAIVADRCAFEFDPPDWKSLDPAHPDAIQPALEISRADTSGKGWVSFQVATRPECMVDADATITLGTPGGVDLPVTRHDLAYAGAVAGDPLPEPQLKGVRQPIYNMVGETELANLEGAPYDVVRVGPIGYGGQDFALDWVVDSASGGECSIELRAGDGSSDVVSSWLAVAAHEHLASAAAQRDSFGDTLRSLFPSKGRDQAFAIEVYSSCNWRATLSGLPK
jgi:hypothetical protein